MKGIILKRGLSANALKIIALISMTIDHIGAYIYPNLDVLRIIGRLAFPLFSFMIAEGCYYTKNRTKYFLMIFGLGLICSAAYYVFSGIIYFHSLTSFSFSILIIYAVDKAVKNKNAFFWLITTLIVALFAFINYGLPNLIDKQKLDIGYGFFAIFLPVAVYYFKDLRLKIVALIVTLLPLSLDMGFPQWYSLLAPVLLIFYDGTRGKLRLKYLFYIYYPLHFVVIYGLGIII